MQLKDAQGRTVVFEDRYVGESGSRQSVTKFHAIDGLNLVEVPEAIVSQGDERFIPKEIVQHTFDQLGGIPIQFHLREAEAYGPIQVGLESGYDGAWWGSSNRRQTYKVNGVTVDEARFNVVAKTVQDLSALNELNAYHYGFAEGWGKAHMPNVLEMIGEGKVVTPESLKRGCAKDEPRPRLLAGDVDLTIAGCELHFDESWVKGFFGSAARASGRVDVFGRARARSL